MVSYGFYLSLKSVREGVGLILVFVLVKNIIHHTLTLFRCAPRSISLNPIHWGIGAVASHWYLSYGIFRQVPSREIVPSAMAMALVCCSAGLFLWARLSLGKHYGIVPANRGLSQYGAYRWVRHPIYTASILAELAYLLGHYSLLNLSLFLTANILIFLRACIEEDFLKKDPLFERYFKNVPFRFLPRVY